jgi:hypothetical protein
MGFNTKRTKSQEKPDKHAPTSDDTIQYSMVVLFLKQAISTYIRGACMTYKKLEIIE